MKPEYDVWAAYLLQEIYYTPEELRPGTIEVMISECRVILHILLGCGMSITNVEEPNNFSSISLEYYTDLNYYSKSSFSCLVDNIYGL
jgi:hypothetical protein